MLPLRYKSAMLCSPMAFSALSITDIPSLRKVFSVCHSGPLFISEQRDRIFDVADVPFSGVSDKEKQLYTSVDEETGWYHAYKLRQHWVSNTFSHNLFNFDASVAH